MSTYVLVPGFWIGAWAWQPVTSALRECGHEVYPLSLTGMAERVHLARPETDVETHVADVVNLLQYEDLHDVVLVGHSYGGNIIPVVADRATDRISQLVFVDTGPLPDGFCQQDFVPPQERDRNAALVAEGDGWRLPPPPWADLAASLPDKDESVLRQLQQRSVPQPWLTATSPVRLTHAWEQLPRVGIMSTMSIDQIRAVSAAMPIARHMVGDQWRYEELPTWHWPMFTRPVELADALDRAAPHR